MSHPEISVAVCTHNRADVLGGALASLAAQTLPAANWELLVVDNGSTDSTRQIVSDFQQATGLAVRYIFEARLGIALARNRAWREARTEFIAFTDDDARAEPEWLARLLRVFRTVSPRPAGVTGRIDLDWLGPRPAWFPERFEPLFARYDMGPAAHWLEAGGYLVTCNAAFACATLEAVGGFREDLGHAGNVNLRAWGGEDSEIYIRLTRAGHRLYYEPAAVVYHLVPPERQTRRYLVRRLYLNGLGQVAIDRVVLPPGQYPGPLAGAFADARMVGRYSLNWLLAGLRRDRLQQDDSLYRLAQKAGRLHKQLRLLGWLP